MRILEQSDADFICLQEVIKEFADIIFSQKWVQDKYFVSQQEMYTWYGVMILSKWPCKFYQYNFNQQSRMGRSLLIAETIINGEPFVVSTVHLESMASAPYRKAQMDISFSILKLFNNSLLMGDYNFDSSWKNEQACIDPGFDDIYLTLNHG